MTRILQSPWLIALTGCLLYLGVTLAVLNPSQLGTVPRALAAVSNASRDEPSWKFRNPEMDQWLREIKNQQQALALREQQLQELQTRLNAERRELTTATQTVYQLQADFDRNVVRITAQESDNLKRQAKVLSTMSPDGAASLIREMPDDDVVRILYTMKADEASPILEAFTKLGQAEARRAALITERMRRTLPPDPAKNSKPPS